MHLDFEGFGWLADWIIAVGQGILAIFTAVAVWVALSVARKDRRERREGEIKRHVARSRLVCISAPITELTSSPTGQTLTEVVFEVKTFERPILNVHAEIWQGTSGRSPVDGEPDCRLSMKVITPPSDLMKRIHDGVLTAEYWRARWADEDGNEWYFDQGSKWPAPYTPHMQSTVPWLRWRDCKDRVKYAIVVALLLAILITCNMAYQPPTTRC